MHSRVRIISKTVDGKLTQALEFNGSIVGGVRNITIIIEPQQLPVAIIELVDFETDILPINQDA